MQNRVLIVILAAIGYLIYFLSPIDLIPDVTGLFGKLDDFALLAYLIWLLRRKKKKPHPPASEREIKNVSWLDSKNPYHILGVSQEATLEEIEQAYRKLKEEYFSEGGEHDELAKIKLNKIQWAYEELRKQSR